MVFRPLAGCGLFRPRSATGSMPSRFPSPCGVWVVSTEKRTGGITKCFRPLAGCGLFLFAERERLERLYGFPSPCGVWVVSRYHTLPEPFPRFPSPCGVWVVSRSDAAFRDTGRFPSPCGVWVVSEIWQSRSGFFRSFRPLAGCGLFLIRRSIIGRIDRFPSPCGVWVVSRKSQLHNPRESGFRPLAGCGLFLQASGLYQ